MNHGVPRMTRLLQPAVVQGVLSLGAPIFCRNQQFATHRPWVQIFREVMLYPDSPTALRTLALREIGELIPELAPAPTKE